MMKHMNTEVDGDDYFMGEDDESGSSDDDNDFHIDNLAEDEVLSDIIAEFRLKERVRIGMLALNAPIARVPPEVLMRIFELAEESCRAQHFAASRNLVLSLCAVSSKWRTIALGVRSLWTFCALPLRGKGEMLQRWLSRSVDRQLALSYENANIYYIEGLASIGLHEVQLAPLRFFCLRLSDARLSWPTEITTSIRSIFMHHVAGQIHDFLTLLRSCPLLEHLTLSETLSGLSLAPPQAGRIYLPKLTSLECSTSTLVIIDEFCRDVCITELSIFLAESNVGLDRWFNLSPGFMRHVSKLSILDARDPCVAWIVVYTASSIKSLSFQNCTNPLVLDTVLGNDTVFHGLVTRAGLLNTEWLAPAITSLTVDNVQQLKSRDLSEILKVRCDAAQTGAVSLIETARIVNCSQLGDLDRYIPEWTKWGIQVVRE